MGQIEFLVEEVSGVPEQLKDVVEHVDHVLIDGGPVRQAINPLTILYEDEELEGLGNTDPA